MNIISPYVSNMLWLLLYGLGRSLNIRKVLSKSLLKCCVCVCSITVNSSLNLPKFDHCKFKFLLEFIGIVVVVVVVLRVFDHCKIPPWILPLF